MPHSAHRRIREDYWYTSAQIDDVGSAWAEESYDRLFLYPENEVVYRSGFEEVHAPADVPFPLKILLPLNKGSNHWTAVTIKIDPSEDNKINVAIAFTDSMNSQTNIEKLDSRIKNEMERIAAIFRKKYGAKGTVTTSIYPHTWRQEDGSSCGPYSLANGIRCLDGKGAETNPGRAAIRKQQLDAMTKHTAIMGCSTSNKIDEILLDWILHQVEQGKSVVVNTPDEVIDICNGYANRHGRDIMDIVNIIHAEYSAGTNNPEFRPYLVNTRVIELIGENGIKASNKFALAKPNKVQAPPVPLKPSIKTDVSKAQDLSKVLNPPTTQPVPQDLPKTPSESVFDVSKTQYELKMPEGLNLDPFMQSQKMPETGEQAESTEMKLEEANTADTSDSSTYVMKYWDDYSELSFEELLSIFEANEGVKRVAEEIQRENIFKLADRIRITLGLISEDHVANLFIMNRLTLAMQKANQAEAEKLLCDNIVKPEHAQYLEECLALVSKIIGARRFSEENNEKFIHLADAYKTLADAMLLLQQEKLANLSLPLSVLQAHFVLLEGAIERNTASALRQVAYAIQDFFSSMLEFFSGGLWQSDIGRIERLQKKFTNTEGMVDQKRLDAEHKAIAQIISARSDLQEYASKNEDIEEDAQYEEDQNLNTGFVC